ncbi:Regulatory protein RecX [Magnetospirillum sp. UT-4]|nr:Regulatory protein RecX [Magnetospirillum sp. UT-4]
MRKAPPKITPSYLENAALHYLERFAASSASVRRVLMRKVDRALEHWGGERSEAAAQVDATMAKLARLGYLDDSAYAATKARALNRQGRPVRVIRAALATKGVDGDTTAAALDGLTQELAEPDLAAAIRFARKRRLGPFRKADAAADPRKELAAMARAGFDLDTARRVLAAADEEAAEALATP